jgi:DNA-binding Lrp family transcriptional regulator
MPNTLLDEVDRELIALLREDARAPTSELARRLGLSRTTVQSRMERLQRQRVITGYTVTVPDEVETALVRAHVLITLAPKQSSAIEQALRRIPQVRAVRPHRHRRRALHRRARHADRPHRRARRRGAHHLGDRAVHSNRPVTRRVRGISR